MLGFSGDKFNVSSKASEAWQFSTLEDGECHYVWKPGQRKPRLRKSLDPSQKSSMNSDSCKEPLLTKQESLLSEYSEGQGDCTDCADFEMPKNLVVTAEIEKEAFNMFDTRPDDGGKMSETGNTPCQEEVEQMELLQKIPSFLDSENWTKTIEEDAIKLNEEDQNIDKNNPHWNMELGEFSVS